MPRIIRTASKSPALVYMHTGVSIPEIADQSVKLFLFGSLYLGRGASWGDYLKLYRPMAAEAIRTVRRDGWFVSLATPEYNAGKCRYKGALLNELFRESFELVDLKIWKRKTIDFFQVPFTSVGIWRPIGGTASRAKIRHRPYLDGVWDFPQRTKGGDAVFPTELCDLLIEAFTVPGDLIVDPMAGSAMLLSRAAAMGRTGRGYEIDRKLIPTIRANNVEVSE